MDLACNWLQYTPRPGVLVSMIIIFFVYWYFNTNHDYWKKRGIPFAKPSFFGYFLDLQLNSFENMELARYFKLGKIYGFYESGTPQIAISDPKLLRNILMKDFYNFFNKRVPIRYVLMGYKEVTTGDRICDMSLPVLRGEDWRRMRLLITPTFSTSKIKRVMNIFQDSSKTLLQNCKIESSKSSFLNLKKLYEAFSMDVIASAAFSTKIDSHNNPENIFVRMAGNISRKFASLQFVIFCLAPKTMKFLGQQLFSTENDFFSKISLEIIEERRRTGQTRNDFLQLLLDIMDETKAEEKWEDTKDDCTSNYKYDATEQSDIKSSSAKHLSKEELIAQCVMFFLAGYHTTSTALTIVTHLLTVHPEEQEKVFQEIKQVLNETDGVLTYEGIQKMKYLDNAISESLRMYSPIIRLERQADEDYKLGDTGLIIPKGMIVSIPIFAMHRDPEFFPEPEKFKPNRFSEAEKHKIKPFTFMPFGAGPRNCVGMRFALMEAKVCLVHVLSTYHLQKCPETKVPLELVRGAGLLQPKSICVHLEERKDCPLVL